MNKNEKSVRGILEQEKQDDLDALSSTTQTAEKI
jgi:hypothetical protein